MTSTRVEVQRKAYRGAWAFARLRAGAAAADAGVRARGLVRVKDIRPRNSDAGDNRAGDDGADGHGPWSAEQRGQPARLGAADGPDADQRLRIDGHHAAPEMVGSDRLDAVVGRCDKGDLTIAGNEERQKR